jgi:hypothetical protein
VEAVPLNRWAGQTQLTHVAAEREMTKLTVEDGLAISVRNVQQKRMGLFSGTIHWYWALGQHAFIRFYTDWRPTPPVVTLCYCDPDGSNPKFLPITLQCTSTRHGGIRWWFSCPIRHGGIECERRCGCLYLRQGHDHFGCRVCHDLTYESSQRAHMSERFLDQIAKKYMIAY